MLKIKGITGPRSLISHPDVLLKKMFPYGHWDIPFFYSHPSPPPCYHLICCFFFSFGNYYRCSEVGANSRRVVRQIPDEILHNSELQDAVRQVKNIWSISFAYNFFKPSGNLHGFGTS